MTGSRLHMAGETEIHNVVEVRDLEMHFASSQGLVASLVARSRR